MAEQTWSGNIVVEDEKEENIINALHLMEGYCMKLHDNKKCDACVIAMMLDIDGNNECPFHREQGLSAPSEWEISEQLYNGGLRIYKREAWEELRKKVGKA